MATTATTKPPVKVYRGARRQARRKLFSPVSRATTRVVPENGDEVVDSPQVPSMTNAMTTGGIPKTSGGRTVPMLQVLT